MHIALVAGEASGDKLGASLIDGLRTLMPDGVQLSGIAGPLMQSRGMDSLFPMAELSVMGLGAILRAYPRLKRRLNETAAHVLAQKPDVLVTIDTPEFSARLAKIVKAQNPDQRIVHYVAPTVWAWRPGRAAKLARHTDQLLALFPFEPPFFTPHGLRCDFVGHPVVSDPLPDAADVAGYRAQVSKGSLFLILPGSRRSEIARHLPIFHETVGQIITQAPSAQFVLPAVAHLADEIKQAVQNWSAPVHVIDARDDLDGQKKALAFSAADCAIAASGTVALELAAHGTPMVIAYDMPWLSRQIFSRLLRIDSVSLPNIVTNTHTIPEFLGPDCTADAIARSALSVCAAPQGQVQVLRQTLVALGLGGDAPGLRAARAILDGLGQTVTVP